MYASLGRSALEFLWLAARGDEAIARHVAIDAGVGGRLAARAPAAGAAS